MMTIKDAKKILDEFDDNYNMPVLGRLFEDYNPYLVSDDFYLFMRDMNSKDLTLAEIYGHLANLGDTQDDLGPHFIHNLWVLIEALQKLDMEKGKSK